MPRVEGVCEGPTRSACVRAARSTRYREEESLGGTLREEVSTWKLPVSKRGYRGEENPYLEEVEALKGVWG